MSLLELQFLSTVWSKAQVVPGYDPNQFRKDVCGAWIAWDKHGKRESMLGWEIDHIIPTSRNGNDDINNLRSLHWQNNARKSDGSLVCVISAR